MDKITVCYIQNYCGLIEADDVVENMHVFGNQKKIDKWFSEQVKDGIEAGYIPEENPDGFIGMKDYELTMSKGNEKEGFTCYGIVCRPFEIEKWRYSKTSRNDTLVRSEGMRILLEGLGKVDAERFISLIIKEPFDYTNWQKDLFSDMNVRELSNNAMKAITE